MIALFYPKVLDPNLELIIHIDMVFGYVFMTLPIHLEQRSKFHSGSVFSLTKVCLTYANWLTPMNIDKKVCCMSIMLDIPIAYPFCASSLLGQGVKLV